MHSYSELIKKMEVKPFCIKFRFKDEIPKNSHVDGRNNHE